MIVFDKYSKAVQNGFTHARKRDEKARMMANRFKGRHMESLVLFSVIEGVRHDERHLTGNDIFEF